MKWRIKQGLESHEQRFVETQALLNEAHSVQGLCDSLRLESQSDLSEEARRLRDAEVELEGAKLVLKALGEYIRKLELSKV